MSKVNPDDLPDEEVWVTSGDVRIALIDMGEKHLRNAVNYMLKAQQEADSEGESDPDVEEKLNKLLGETERRLNLEPQKPESLPITQTRLDAQEAYRRMQE